MWQHATDPDPVKIPREDLMVLEDYQNFRAARASLHLRKSDWAKLSKRSKAAIGRLLRKHRMYYEAPRD